MECDSYRDQMLNVLYGESDPESARRVEEHQSSCESCREEMSGLRRVRRDLRAWTLPPAPVALRARPGGSRVRQALAIAAGLVMAAGAALGFSGSELRYADGRLAFRLGRAAAGPDVAALLAAQEARFRSEIEALKAQRPVGVAEPRLAAATPGLAAPDPGALDAAVRRLVQESEARQVAILNSSLSDLEDRLADQRRADLERVGTGLAMVDGRSTL